MKGSTKTGARAVLDMSAIVRVREMKKCSRACPAFILCPLMPLAIQPKKDTERICLVNLGDDRLKIAYYKMFVGGQEGVVQMLQTSILEYGDLLKKFGNNMTTKDRLRAMEKFNSMLGQLHKMMGQSQKPSAGGKAQADDDEMDEVVLIASQNEPKPDPESLDHSPMLQDLLTHEDTLYATKPKVPEPQEVDLGKEILDKFFGNEE